MSQPGFSQIALIATIILQNCLNLDFCDCPDCPDFFPLLIQVILQSVKIVVPTFSTVLTGIYFDSLDYLDFLSLLIRVILKSVKIVVPIYYS